MSATSSILARYEKTEKPVGEGTYGQVYKAKEIATGRIVALKKIRLEADDEGIPSTALREISLLKDLDHENIVQLYDVEHCRNPDELYLVFEWLDKDLRKYIESQRETGLDRNLIKSYLHQILRGLDHCHSRAIIHRDLKPQNLLINRQGAIKIADFGLARAFSIPLRTYTHEIVTLWYRSPEVLLGQRTYNLGVDMWSVGTIFGEMFNIHALFPGDSEIDEIFRIFRALGTPTEETWPEISQLPDYQPVFPMWPKPPLSQLCPTMDDAALDLLERFFAYRQSDRISARDALSHPYFADFDSTSI